MKHKAQIVGLLALVVLLVAAPGLVGQTVQQPSGAEPQPGAGGDPIRQLNLTPEQREQIRTIRQENKEERARINERLLETNRALDEALNAEEPAEGVIEQRVRDLAAAQAAAMRMRVSTEIRIRRVLTLEQRRILRTLQQEAIRSRQERRQDNAEERQRRRQEQNRSLQNQRNGLGPLNPRRNPQRRPLP